MQNFLKGKKTYLTVIASIIGIAIAVANGEKDIAGAIAAIGVLVAQAFSRSGLSTEVKKLSEQPKL